MEVLEEDKASLELRLAEAMVDLENAQRIAKVCGSSPLCTCLFIYVVTCKHVECTCIRIFNIICFL